MAAKPDKRPARTRSEETIAREHSTLSVQLLGEFQLRRGDARPMPVGSARIASLLGYLLLNQSPQSRQRLASVLWPDSTDSQARTNLRHLLHELRRAVPDIERLIDLGAHALHWTRQQRPRVDVDTFERALENAEATNEAAVLDALRQAVDVYRGDLLEGLDAEWILAERDRFRVRFVDALERLAMLLVKKGAYPEAIRHAERLLQEDPLREDTYRLLMQLHEAQGARARALRVYHTCVAVLARELGVEPSAATRRVYESLLAQDDAPREPDAAVAESGAVQLVGRSRELAVLQHAWLASERGVSQLVIVKGEAGIGKSRLVEELRSWCARRGASTADAQAYAAEGALAYSPIVAWLRADAFRQRLARPETRRRELGRLLPELVEKSTDRTRAAPGSDSEERQRLFDAVASVLVAPGAPTLLVADDLQWFDPDSLHCIHYLMRAAPTARVLIVATVRTEEVGLSHGVATWVAAAKTLNRCIEVELGRLSQADTAALAAGLGRTQFGPDAIEQLHRETEGNPLFIVEALRGGWRATGERWTTPKVQGVIEWRLSHLSASARDLLTTAASIGREFTSEVLARATDIAGQAFVSALDELWRRGLIRERGTHAYDFSHDKIREVAYLQGSPVRRRHDHLRIARALEEIHALDPRAVSGIIATHYELAGAIGSAITWHERAAAAALKLGANAEALRILERALDALGSQPQSPDRDSREIAILATMVTLLGSFEGYGSSKLEETLRRAVSLAEGKGMELSPPLLRSLAVSSLTKGNFEAAWAAGDQLRARADRNRDHVLRVEAEYVLGIAAFWQGSLARARGHFESAVAHYSADHGVTHLVHYAQDPKVVCLSRLANTLWLLGEFREAWRSADLALTMANRIGHLHTRATALTFATLLAIEGRDDSRVRSYAAAISDAITQRESIQSRIGADAISGYVDVLDGRYDPGIARIRRALDDLRGAVHAPGIHVVLGRILVEACFRADRARAGLEAANRALASAGNVRVFEAEMRRLRAVFLAAVGAPQDEVTTELAHASEIARQQDACAFELRICATLLQYRRRFDDAAETGAARQRLARALAARARWDDGPDVRAATALLAD